MLAGERESYAMHRILPVELQSTGGGLAGVVPYVMNMHMSPRVHPLAPSDPLEDVWRALGDRTRRAMLNRLRQKPHTTGEIAELFPQTRFAVIRHLDVLVSAGLVIVRRDGRERWNQLNPVPLQDVYEQWVRPYEGLWAAPLIRFSNAIESQPHATTPPDQVPMPSSTEIPRVPTSPGLLTVEMEVRIAAAPSRVWEALTTQAARWWPRDFLIAAPQMQFEARLGGPTQSLLRIELREQGDVTVLSLTDAVVGNVGANSANSLDAGWRAIFDDGLRAFVEA